MTHQIKEPTKSELDILQVLWAHGPSTVRFVNDKLNERDRQVRYTSTLKLMQIMIEKGMLIRDEGSMKHVYSPVEGEQKIKNELLKKFLASTFNGSVSGLVMQLLGDRGTSKKELDEIRAWLDNLDEPDR